MKIRYSLRSFLLLATLLGLVLVLVLSLVMRPARIEVASQSRKYDDLAWYVIDEHTSPSAGRHVAIYLAWLCERDGLINSEFHDESPESMLRLKKREITPLEFLQECDGVLMSDFMSEDGMLFSDFYYNEYSTDFRSIDTRGATSWQLYDDLKPLLDQRFEAWEASN